MSKLLFNPTFYPVVITVILCQMVKGVKLIKSKRKFSIQNIFAAGGVVSIHSAAVSSLTTAIALNHPKGIGSMSFASALIFSIIVMYDASGVRRSAGENSRMLNKVMDAFESDGGGQFSSKNHLDEIKGHTPSEVLAGAFLGLAITLLLHQFTG